MSGQEFQDGVKLSILLRTIDEIPEFKSLVFQLMEVYQAGQDIIHMRKQLEELRKRAEFQVR